MRKKPMKRLLAMVLERHGKNGNIGYGFLTGSCLREGTVATTVSGYMKGCRFFRVHDVKENMRAMKMIEAICAK